MTSLHQRKYAIGQGSQTMVWVACPISGECSHVTLLCFWTTSNKSLIPPMSTPNISFSVWGLALLFCPPSSLPGSHLTLVGRTHSEHTSQIPQGHGQEKLECRWTPDRTGNQTGSEPAPGNLYCHTVDTKQEIYIAMLNRIFPGSKWAWGVTMHDSKNDWSV